MQKAIEFIKDYCPQPGVFVPQGTKAVADEWEEENLAVVITSTPVTKNGGKDLKVTYLDMREYTKDI